MEVLASDASAPPSITQIEAAPANVRSVRALHHDTWRHLTIMLLVSAELPRPPAGGSEQALHRLGRLLTVRAASSAQKD
eukprot:750859-Hanusia_phi.AAC.2